MRLKRVARGAGKQQIRRTIGFAAIESLERRSLLSAAAAVALTPGDATSTGPIISSTTADLTWSAVDGVSGYQIHVYDKTKASSISVNVDAGTTQYSVTLRAGDQFVWNVRDLIGTTTGTVSNYLNFQTPGWSAPTITGPGSSVAPGPVLTTLTPTLTWNAVSSTVPFSGYQINLYDQTTKKLQSFIAPASATSYTLPTGALTAGDTYLWNLRVTDGAQTGPESLPYFYFQAPAASTVPTLPAPVAIGPGSSTSPGPVLTTLAPTFTWNAVTTAAPYTGYQITLYNQTSKQSQTFIASASATSFTAPAGTLTAGDSYVWNLRLINGSQTGPVSQPYLFFQAPAASTTPVTLPAPVIVAPGSSIAPGPVLTTLTPTLSWNAVTTTATFTGYQVNLYDLTARRSQTFVTSAAATSFKLPTGSLIAGHSYVWNLRLRNGTTTGPESHPYLYFQAPPAAVLPAPAIVSPGSTTAPGPKLGTLTPTFKWNAVANVSGLTGYQINLYNITTRRSFSYRVGASVTQFAISAGILAAGDQYVWNVRALASGQSGLPSAYLFFSV